MAKSTGSERVAEMVGLLRKWQTIERKSMAHLSEILEKTTNPFLRIIMEVIRHDSLMHHRVQQTLVDSLTRQEVPLRFEEIAEIWSEIEAHDAMEKQVVDLARTLHEKAWNPVHKQLLAYLAADEEKHDRLLEQLDEIKKQQARATN